MLKGKVVGEEYFPLGHTQFNSVINKIKLTKPDVIFTDVVGGSNVAFYKQLKAAGIDLSKQTLLTISVTEDEIDGIGGENIAGAYACMKYFQSLDNREQQDVRAAFKKMWGEKTVIGDVTQAAYLGPWLWKLTVEKAGSFDVDKIAAASPGIEFKGAPEGYVRIHENHHLWSKTRVGKAKLDGQFELIYRDRRPGRAGSVPQGLPVRIARSARDLSRFPKASPWRGSSIRAQDPRVANLLATRDFPRRRRSMFGDYSIGDLGSIFVMQGFAGLILFSVYVLMALGLAIIFGQMGVINMAHGEFMILGAYVTWMTSNLFQHYLPSLFPGYFFLAMMLAFCASGALGMLVEWVLIRHLYKRPLDTLLATWGLSLILQQAYRSIFGAREVGVELPQWMLGSLQVTDSIEVPINGMFVMCLTLLITIAVAYIMYKSRWGRQVRAVVQNRIMAGAVGINTEKVDRYTFGLGCGIAGVAGSAFTMIGSTGPTSGQLYIVDTFLVVVFGGAASLIGTIASAFSHLADAVDPRILHVGLDGEGADAARRCRNSDAAAAGSVRPQGPQITKGLKP